MEPGFIADVSQEFHHHKALADQALAQLDDQDFFRRPAENVNPAAVIVKHLSGNLVSRWTDFLTSDGEKPSRNRDDEFRLAGHDTRADLLETWERGWDTLFATLATLGDDDLQRTVLIRGEAHTARRALLRAVTHAAYHTGQILYLVRLLRPDSPWLTIVPGQSRNHQATYTRPR